MSNPTVFFTAEGGHDGQGVTSMVGPGHSALPHLLRQYTTAAAPPAEIDYQMASHTGQSSARGHLLSGYDQWSCHSTLPPLETPHLVPQASPTNTANTYHEWPDMDGVVNRHRGVTEYEPQSEMGTVASAQSPVPVPHLLGISSPTITAPPAKSPPPPLNWLGSENWTIFENYISQMSIASEPEKASLLQGAIDFVYYAWSHARPKKISSTQLRTELSRIFHLPEELFTLPPMSNFWPRNDAPVPSGVDCSSNGSSNALTVASDGYGLTNEPVACSSSGALSTSAPAYIDGYGPTTTGGQTLTTVASLSSQWDPIGSMPQSEVVPCNKPSITQGTAVSCASGSDDSCASFHQDYEIRQDAVAYPPFPGAYPPQAFAPTSPPVLSYDSCLGASPSGSISSVQAGPSGSGHCPSRLTNVSIPATDSNGLGDDNSSGEDIREAKLLLYTVEKNSASDKIIRFINSLYCCSVEEGVKFFKDLSKPPPKCGWEGCTHTYNLEDKDPVVKHLRDAGHLPLGAKDADKIVCQVDNCSNTKTMRVDSLKKHVRSIHVGTTVTSCGLCGTKVSRPDEIGRHLAACKGLEVSVRTQVAMEYERMNPKAGEKRNRKKKTTRAHPYQR